jgi:hypothetical protein
MYSNRYTCQIFNKAWIFLKDFWSVQVSSFIHISSLRAELFYANRQTGMTNLIGGFHNFAKTPKNEHVLKKSEALRAVSE